MAKKSVTKTSNTKVSPAKKMSKAKVTKPKTASPKENTKENIKQNTKDSGAKSKTQHSVLKAPVKVGILGQDLNSKFLSEGHRTWKPTKPGGRNGQGKP